jgi:hypothetical protein
VSRVAACVLVGALLLVPALAGAAVGGGGLRIRNGWYAFQGRPVWGYIQHNGWWRVGQRPNLARRAPLDGDVDDFSDLDVRPNRTEDLDALSDNMLRYGYPGFEHNYGLWFDRRRDAHTTFQQPDDAVVAPFLEQPWARSGNGVAWDGLSRYDLKTFNDWYFQRLRDFADLCDAKGTILFHNSYMQHALLEDPAHYVDFPWRPTNNVQGVDMPDQIPAANAFYDVSDPQKRKLHRRYVRKTLNELGSNTNVVYLTSEEYTGPLDFVDFWIDTILEWESDKGEVVHIGLGATKDVLDAVLADPVRGPAIGTIDLRYWWIQPDGSLFAPAGGEEVPGRYFDGIVDFFPTSAHTTPERIYEQVRAYRDRYPDKAIIHAIEATREQTWAFFMAGGSMLMHGQIEYPGQVDPPDYVAPPDWDVVQPLYEFVRDDLGAELLRMAPSDCALSNPESVWCLAKSGRNIVVYSLYGDEMEVDLSEETLSFRARWLDPRTGALSEAGTVEGGGAARFTPPSAEDWALWLEALPRTVSVTAFPSHVWLVFDRDLDAASAAARSSYAIDGATIDSVTLIGGNLVVLDTSPMTPESEHQLSFSGLRDGAGAAFDPAPVAIRPAGVLRCRAQIASALSAVLPFALAARRRRRRRAG